MIRVPVRQILAFAVYALPLIAADEKGPQHQLYVASPGIRNYTEWGGVGVLAFDIDHGYRLVKRFPTWQYKPGEEVQNVKGFAANAATGKMYVSNNNRVMAMDIVTGKKLWDKAYEAGCDRMALSPDGKTMYLPELEGPAWHVVNAETGDVMATIETKSGSHNTIWAPDGSRVYLAGLKSPILRIADPKSNEVTGTVGPFGAGIRPFTVNGNNTLVFVNVNDLLGFEVGDVRTGKKLYRVEVQGFKNGPVARHGCPSHGIAMTPDEKELWVVDGPNNAVHVFDATAMPPRQGQTIQLNVFPGWISFSMDGKYAYASTGDIIDAASKKIIATLKDETGHLVQSEKLLDLEIEGGRVVRAGNQFGVGMKTADASKGRGR
jgi:DNA-binding beta-propeller fold protein YncE